MVELMNLLRNWVIQEHANLLIEQARQALGWAIVVTDIDSRHDFIYGIVADPADALTRAARIQQELNDDSDAEDLGYRVTTYPVLPIEDWGVR